VPEALRAAGLDIRVHDELFPQATQDVVWLREAGAPANGSKLPAMVGAVIYVRVSTNLRS
jgi:hypothetical protein